MSPRPTSIIDTNIICRHALQDHEDHSPRANALFERLWRGDEVALVPETAVFEAIHIMHRRYSVPRTDVDAYFSLVLSYPGIVTEHSGALLDALSFWASQPSLDVTDCYHLALAKELGMTQVYSFDKKMVRYAGVERIEPE